MSPVTDGAHATTGGPTSDYTRNSSDDDVTVTVAQPINGMITGGGHLINTSSAGEYAGGMSSLSTNVREGTASFMSKANLTDITDPLEPETLLGNLDLQMTMKDNGNPGTSDTIAVTLRNSSGALLFSSNWSGTTTLQQSLSGGNLVVR
jgi:hypothetical protein